MKLGKDDRAEVNITEVANHAEEGHIAGEDDIMQKDTADPDTDWVKANFVPLPHSARAPHESNSTSNLKTDDVNPTTCSHSSSRRPYSTSRVSIATQRIARLYIICTTVPEPPLPLEQAAAIRRNVRPQPADLAVRAEQRHPSQNRAESGMELKKDDRAETNITEVANLAEKDGIAGEDNVMTKEKFKLHRGGRRLTARKHRQRMQDGDQGNPDAGSSSATETLFAPVPSSAANDYQPLSSTAFKNSA